MKKLIKCTYTSFMTLFTFLCLLLLGCGGGNSQDSNENKELDEVTLPITIEEIESNIRTELDKHVTELDFTFMIKSESGRSFVHNTGNSSEFVTYESASTSKLVTAVIILSLVEDDILSLDDHPQNYITSWPQSGNLADITLHDLLNFTSGLTNEPFCLYRPLVSFDGCVDDIVTQNISSKLPGSEYYYSAAHLQVAGLMAVKASGYSSWDELFNQFQSDTSLFLNSAYDLPSRSNPRLAGGMHWTGDDYINFLEALFDKSILSQEIFTQLASDQIGTATIANSPAITELNEDWHYGYGVWIECLSNPYTCEQVTRISSPGSFGAYPFIDLEHNYYGMVARQGSIGTTKEGVDIFRAVESLVEDWASK